MIQFTTHQFLFFSRREIWFYDGESIEEGTYTVFIAAREAPGTKVNYLTEYTTVLTDLLKSKDELLNSIHPGFRYDIRSAEKWNFQIEVVFQPTVNQCEQTLNAFQKFAKSKNLLPIDQKSFLALNRSNSVCITKISKDNVEIVTHIYVADKEEVMLSHSYHNSDFINERIRGEANKLLHWKDIELFKSIGFKQYDWGGINIKKKSGISKFKQNFGGNTATKFRYIKSSPLVYSIFKAYKYIWSKTNKPIPVKR